MKQKFFIFFALILMVLILIGLNAFSYVQKEQVPDNELTPNRSTFNVGTTGTRAFYDFLAESGFRVSRWRDPISKIKNFDENIVGTFVVIGRVRREFTDDEITGLLNWVSAGGRLVVIDRDPPKNLIATTANYSIEFSGGEESMPEVEKDSMLYSVDPSNHLQMTAETVAARSLQPTVFTKDVNAVQSSKFASSIKFARLKETDSNEDDSNEDDEISESPTESPDEVQEVETDIGTDMAGRTAPEEEEEEHTDISLTAPVAHIANDEKTLAVDFPFGAGQMVFLTDPYIVANGGIKLADNIQFATNVVGSRRGVIAFDEFHQGYSNSENQFLAYFADTPLVPILLQLLAITGLVFFSQSRRFGRPFPPTEPNRLSKLEYVAAMAQLQQRTKAFDLAIENIYLDFRRRVSRLVGVDNHTTSRKELSELVADRTKYGAREIEDLLFKCEDIMHGEPTRKKEVVELTSKLREVEEELGLIRRKRKR